YFIIPIIYTLLFQRTIKQKNCYGNKFSDRIRCNPIHVSGNKIHLSRERNNLNEAIFSYWYVVDCMCLYRDYFDQSILKKKRRVRIYADCCHNTSLLYISIDY